MFARGPAASRRRRAVLAAIAAATVAGCGGGSEESSTPAADAGDVEVIEAWARTLAAGDEEGAAGYFAIPSVAENGPTLVKIESRADAVAFNRALPCGAEVVSARTTGELTTATFVLSDRPGGDCGAGAGATASTTFEIEDGKIVEWRRVDDAPTPGGAGEGGTAV
ncbi:MAG: hypothetical protein R2718_11625 [Solirubrobacterales bacterium]|nr:hypothetical protein [Solirubrobacterales bacterium]